MQGKNDLKRINPLCYNFRPTVLRPLQWYCNRHLVTGFAYSLNGMRECTCEFVTVGHDVFLKATSVLEEEELYMYYKFP
jgi:hypothetical protein